MSTANKQSGFSIEVGVIAVVVVAVVGFIGWSVYNNYSSKSTPTEGNQTNSQSTSNSPTKESTIAATITPQSTYLDIKDFGIKIPLDSSIADATYILDPNLNSNPAKAQTVDVTTKSLAATSNNQCNILEITRTQDQNILGTPLVPNGTTIFKIGNYYYVLNGPQSLCSTDSKVNQLRLQHSSTFAKDFKSEQPDN